MRLWSMDEDLELQSQTLFAPFSNGSMSSTASERPTWTTSGYSDDALSFDGTNDYWKPMIF